MRYLLSFLLMFFSSALAQVATDLVLPEGYTATVVINDLRGPTQMILGPDGRVWIAQLAGGESEGKGEILAVSLETGKREVLLNGLFKPTGLAVFSDYL